MYGGVKAILGMRHLRKELKMTREEREISDDLPNLAEDDGIPLSGTSNLNLTLYPPKERVKSFDAVLYCIVL